MLVLTACLLAILDPPAEQDQEKLQGTWAVVAVEQSGRKLPDENPIYKRKYVFEADRYFVKGEEGNKNSVATYKLDFPTDGGRRVKGLSGSLVLTR